MITVKLYDGNPLNNLGKYVAQIDLKGSVCEKWAPYGSGTGEPHCVGYGHSIEAATKSAFETLGRHLVQLTKLPDREPDPDPIANS